MADVSHLAYQISVRNGINNTFYKRNEKAGKKWLKNFLSHHQEISVRNPESLSLSRASVFEINEPALDTFQPNSARLYSCDETGITIVQHKYTKILGLRCKRQISSLHSAEWGPLVTVVTCMSPTSSVTCFSKKKCETELMNGTPPGSIHACHPSGRIQSEIFTHWFLRLIKHTKPAKEDPVILVPDGHYSHTRSLEVIILARENNVNIICLPPHNSHKMQPLVKASMWPLKTFYYQKSKKSLFQHRTSRHRLPNWRTIRKCIKRAAKGEIVANAFRTTGLIYCVKSIYRPHDFCMYSDDTDAYHVSHPALVKTSDQPSFSSAIFSPFPSAETLQASDISIEPSLNLSQILVVEQQRKYRV